MDWRKEYQSKYMTPAQAAAVIKSGDVIASSMASGVPYVFLDALADRAGELADVVVYIAGYKLYKLGAPEYKDHFTVRCGFLGAPERYYISKGSPITYQSFHLSDGSRDRALYHRANVLAVAGTPPDANGFISLGPSPTDAALLDCCDTVIVQVNENMPYVRGEGTMFPVSRVDILVDGTEDIPSIDPGPVSPEERAIGSLISERVPDGACIQLGIGGMGTAMGEFLRDKKDLGIHTEMFVESMVGLMECGAVNNSRKKLCPGKTVFGFAAGSAHLNEFITDNPHAESRPFSWVNDPRVISQNDNVVSVNAAMQVDLSGQVCAESIGLRQYSGTGGQADFVRGARWSRGGMSFIALPSSRTDKQGTRYSKISLALPEGSAVTTPRADVQFIATEYGIADLRCATLDERARRLIAVSHPEFRDELFAQAKKAGIII